MTALKGKEIEGFVADPDFSRPVIFLYGPDEGLVSERADEIARKSGVDLKDPFSLIRLNADEAAGDPLRLADEANTIGMFGGKRLIRISGQTRRDLFKCVKPVLDSPPEDAWLIIEAGNLDSRSALRRNLEKHINSVVIPCYQDNAAALDKLIDEEIVRHGFSIDRESRAELRILLGENRMLSRNELKKLALFCDRKSDITIADIRAMVGDGSQLVLSGIADAVASGQTGPLQLLLPKAIEAGNRPDMILQNCLKHFQILQLLRSRIEQGERNISALVSSPRPPIHFTRQDAIKSALHVWPTANIVRALKRLDLMMLEARRNAVLGDSVAGTTLLALSMEAERLGRQKR